MLLDKLQSAIDQGNVAILQGSDGISYLEKLARSYDGVVAGQDVDGQDWQEILDRLRATGRPTYNAGWSSAWQIVTAKEALAIIKRPLEWFQAVTGLKDYHLSNAAKVDSSLLNHAKQGGHIAEGPAKRICEALSQELGQAIIPSMIKWYVLK